MPKFSHFNQNRKNKKDFTIRKPLIKYQKLYNNKLVDAFN